MVYRYRMNNTEIIIIPIIVENLAVNKRILRLIIKYKRSNFKNNREKNEFEKLARSRC